MPLKINESQKLFQLFRITVSTYSHCIVLGLLACPSCCPSLAQVILPRPRPLCVEASGLLLKVLLVTVDQLLEQMSKGYC